MLADLYSRQTSQWKEETQELHLQLNKMEDPILRNIRFSQMVQMGKYCVFDLPEDFRKEILEKLCKIIRLRAQLCILVDADTSASIVDPYIEELKSLIAPLLHVRDGVHVDRFMCRGYSCGFVTSFCDCIHRGGRVDDTQFRSADGLNNGSRANYCTYALRLHGFV